MDLNLLDFIKALAESLMITTDIEEQKLEHLVESIRGDLDGIRVHYADPPPPGAEGVQELMLEMLTLYDQSLMHILSFVQDREGGHLREAIYLAETANDVLLAVEDVVQTNKRLLSDMIEADSPDDPPVDEG